MPPLRPPPRGFGAEDDVLLMIGGRGESGACCGFAFGILGWIMTSIQNRMILFVLVSSGLLLAVGAGLLQARMGAVLESSFDDALVAKVSVLASQVAVEPENESGIEFNFGDEFMPEFERARQPEYFQLRFGSGELIESSGSLGERVLGFHAGVDLRPLIRDLVLLDGSPGRCVELDFIPENEGADFGPWFADQDETVVAGVYGAVPNFLERFPAAGLTLVYARSRAGLNRDLRAMRWATVLVSVLMLLGIGLILLRAGRMVTDPIEALGEELKAIEPGRFSKRVGARRYPLEVEPLVEQVNDLLGRVEQSFLREKRFSSDVAHELRSPVTKLRLMAEVGGMGADLSQEQRELFSDFDDAARRLESIVHGLLVISRVESGGAAAELEPTDVAQLVQAISSELQTTPELEGQELKLIGPPGCVWLMDGPHFSIALRNLLGNARAHGDPDGGIEVEWGAGLDRGFVCVRNRAAGLGERQLGHLFDRFWRKDSSRPADGHFGLGLSIVKAICDWVGWSLDARLLEGEWLEIRISGIERSEGESQGSAD